MPNTHTNPPGLSTPTGYTHVVSATGGRTIYLSGQVPVNAAGEVVGQGDLAAQARAGLREHQDCSRLGRRHLRRRGQADHLHRQLQPGPSRCHRRGAPRRLRRRQPAREHPRRRAGPRPPRVHDRGRSRLRWLGEARALARASARDCAAQALAGSEVSASMQVPRTRFRAGANLECGVCRTRVRGVIGSGPSREANPRWRTSARLTAS